MSTDMNKLRARVVNLASSAKLDLDVQTSVLSEVHEEVHSGLQTNPEDPDLQEIHQDIHQDIHEFLVGLEGRN